MSTRKPERSKTKDAPGADTADTAVDAAYKHVCATAELPQSEARIDKLEEKLSDPVSKLQEAHEKLKAYYAENQSVIDSAGNALASVVEKDNFKFLSTALNKFAETSAVLVQGLDILAQVHPFVAVAVLPFKLMLKLDSVRRQNNRKVLAVKIQMQDMLSVLFQLRDMRDPVAKAPDGTILENRMSGLMHSIADDIKDCANACDFYMKKNLFLKTINCLAYEQRLTGYVVKFRAHKSAVGFALKVHTSLGVDAANSKLDEQSSNLILVLERVDAIFRKVDTPQERDLREFIDKHGGAKTCVNDDAVLRDFVSLSKKPFASFDPTGMGHEDRASEHLKRMLNQELEEDLDKSLQRNMELFQSKLDLQRKDLENTITSTGEHIIASLSGGAYKKVSDQDLQVIWQLQGWRGNVKARNLALALNFYYIDKFTGIGIGTGENAASTVAGSAASSVVEFAPSSPVQPPPTADQGFPTMGKPQDDQWALAYIGIPYLQEIMEAVDDNGAGYISIKEANEFARRRPEGWSLVGWLAFCGAGWHTSVTWYKNRIYNILRAMVGLAQRLKPANVQAAFTYLAGPEIQRLELLLRSTRSTERPALDGTPLRRLTDEFQIAEAQKFEDRLKALHYELDGVNTVRLVTKTRRVEHYLYPLLYQLLKRHFDILRLACLHILDESEFSMMRDSLASIFRTVDVRKKMLKAIFKSHSLDVGEQLGKFAFGMFQPVSDAYERVPKKNTIGTFVEDDAFKYSHEDLGPESDDDEDEAERIIAKIDVNILRCGTKEKPESDLKDVFVFKRYCDSCGGSISGTRFFCIQCMDDRYLETVDLCSNCRNLPARLKMFVHTPAHLLIKTPRPIHDGEMAWMVPDTKVLAKRVKKALKDPSGRRPRCCCCPKNVSPPCWVCTVCPKDTFVCGTCEDKHAVALPNGPNPKHKLSHPLVKIFDSEPIQEAKSVTTEVNLSGLEKKISALEEKFESRLTSLEAILNDTRTRKEGWRRWFSRF